MSSRLKNRSTIDAFELLKKRADGLQDMPSKQGNSIPVYFETSYQITLCSLSSSFVVPTTALFDLKVRLGDDGLSFESTLLTSNLFYRTSSTKPYLEHQKAV
jgi:hypothetical protein